MVQRKIPLPFYLISIFILVIWSLKKTSYHLKFCIPHITVLFLLGFYSAYSQPVVFTDTLEMDEIFSGENVSLSTLSDKKNRNWFYWNNQSAEAAIKLLDGKSIAGFPVKYDLYNKHLEIVAGYNAKTLEEARIREFYIDYQGKRHHFINFNDYFKVGGIQKDVYELLYEGNLNLLGRVEAMFINPGYKPPADAGNLKEKMTVVQTSYLYDGVRLWEIPRNKNKAIGLFQQFKPDVKAYIKEFISDFRDVSQLAQLVHYCNQSE